MNAQALVLTDNAANKVRQPVIVKGMTISCYVYM